MLDVKGMVITANAMHYQKETAQAIVKYILVILRFCNILWNTMALRKNELTKKKSNDKMNTK